MRVSNKMKSIWERRTGISFFLIITVLVLVISLSYKEMFSNPSNVTSPLHQLVHQLLVLDR